MFRKIAASILAFMIAANAVSAREPYRRGHRIEPAEFARELQWVADQLGVPAPPPPPVFLDYQTMQSLGGAASRPREGEARVALYSLGMVWLSELAWNPDDPAQVALLVHELVNHVQAASGHPMGCAAEADAYRLQNEWLALHGMAPAASAEFIRSQVERC